MKTTFCSNRKLNHDVHYCKRELCSKHTYIQRKHACLLQQWWAYSNKRERFNTYIYIYWILNTQSLTWILVTDICKKRNCPKDCPGRICTWTDYTYTDIVVYMSLLQARSVQHQAEMLTQSRKMLTFVIVGFTPGSWLNWAYQWWFRIDRKWRKTCSLVLAYLS